MKQKERSVLKNVTRYGAVQRKHQHVQPNKWRASHNDVQAGIDQLLGYGGVGRLRLQGSFLGEVPGLTNLPVARVAELLDMSKTTFYRAKDEPELDMGTVDRLSSLFKIYQRGMEAFEGLEPFEEWLQSKIANLGDQRPIDFLITESGRTAVLEAIDRVEYGVYG
jgi:putative toxin-antitoxin system antitoxin component (TIGR02293 family)